MAKRKMTTKQRLVGATHRANEIDERWRQQAAAQLQVINRLLNLHKAMEDWLLAEGRLDDWQAHLEHVTADPCAICGDPRNHYGLPHGEVTGDGRTRADAPAQPTAEPSTSKD